ncbi:MAG: hypothetical protein H6709_09180 [Kofleriaceae bacterium]|nr:hypothetical protein [Kofleriaceae bacterium]MCB9572243.1 hypothetical protein [Kofleriaceae bacterium]
MASFTKISETKRKRNHRNMGRRRKAALSRRSTLTAAELFAACGEPGKPAPVAAPTTK